MITAPTIGAPSAVELGKEACEGRKDFRIILDFSVGTTQLIDLTTFLNQGTVLSVQSMYVNVQAGTAPLKFTFNGTNQVIDVPAGAQAYLPVLVTNPPSFTVSCTNAAQISYIQLLNFFVPPFMWGQAVSTDIPAIDAIIANGRMNVRTAPAILTAETNRSGTIAVTNTGQVVMATNNSRVQWDLQNPSTATEILQFSKFSIGGPWYDLMPGQTVSEDGNVVFPGTLWVRAVTVGHAFTSSEGTL